MNYKLASSYGFCFGVKRAIKIAENTPHSVTYGPLIHNKMEIDRLKQHFNVGLTEEFGELSKENTVVIRTHGIQKHELDELKKNDFNVVDATCPYVTKPQEICEKMSKEGYDIVIFGDKVHPEVKGVMSYAENMERVFVVLDTSELMGAGLREKVAVVSQTTRKFKEFMQIVEWLLSRSKEVRVFNTICNATGENQEAADELSKEADIMLVVGGKNSSNTKQLLEICKTNCKESYLVESAEDIENGWFDGKKLCGISAGASTPDWVITEVVEKVRKI
ncbi:MAG: 4-hydroxy-3-methylbut-2-enyl diphosphate reductase [Campylobacteraceae bacterium]|jgi:4-hydroxy-3-methylbut-2-enyl diphosphate reductase|nr:4-hydroxy-3-methylbut-2-enyl diphosphate reductase [Campylobacteraceae bacterium]